MATAAVETVFHSFAIISCCQIETQNPPANSTTQKICKSRGLAMIHSRAGETRTQPVRKL